MFKRNSNLSENIVPFFMGLPEFGVMASKRVYVPFEF